jgi:hypothetical protein
MAVCVRKKRKKTYICTGSLDKLIEICERSITPQAVLNQSQETDEIYTVLIKLWAMVETPNSEVVFENVESPVTTTVTHVFYVRRFPISTIRRITAQHWIRWVYKNPTYYTWYRILSVTNLEENNLYLKIKTTFSGDTDIPASEG